MKPRTYALVALTIPIAAIALMMAPILVSFIGKPGSLGDLFMFSVAFGFPQYVAFAIVLALVTRRMSGAAIHRLALWAPVLFVPLLAGPVMFAQGSFVDAMQILLSIGGLGLTVGYVCVFFAVGLWPAFVRDDAPPPAPEPGPLPDDATSAP